MDIVNILKEVAFFLINGIRKALYFSCSFIPIQQYKVFVNYFDGKGYGDHPKYIIEALLKVEPDIKIYWTYLGKESKSGKIRYIKPFSIKAIYHQATSKVWISTVRMPYYSIKRDSQKYIQTWHGGLAFKKIEHECENALSPRYKRTCIHDSKMIDYYISSNKDNSKLYKEEFWFQGGEILEVGSPRNDIFFQTNNQLKNEIAKKFKVNNKIAVYAPTFRKDNSFCTYNIDLERLRKNLKLKWGGDWLIVVRLHPRLAEISGSYIKYSDFIVDGSKIEDIQELLLITDVLITDYSSIALDYISIDKPVFIYASDIDEYKKERDFHLNLEDTPFSISINNDELEYNIRTFKMDIYVQNVHAFRNRYGYFDNGTASMKVAGLISKIISE